MKQKLTMISALFVATILCQNMTAQKMSDQQFVDKAAQIDMTEAHLGQLAQEKAAAQDVKDYGRELDSDHTANYRKLQLAAQGMNVPQGIDAQHNTEINHLSKLSGAQFDRMFRQHMIQGHEQAITLFKNASTELQNQQLKSYASETLPNLQKHLEDARNLAKETKVTRR